MQKTCVFLFHEKLKNLISCVFTNATIDKQYIYRKLPHISPPEYKPMWHVFLLFSYCSLTKTLLRTTLSPWTYTWQFTVFYKTVIVPIILLMSTLF